MSVVVTVSVTPPHHDFRFFYHHENRTSAVFDDDVFRLRHLILVVGRAISSLYLLLNHSFSDPLSITMVSSLSFLAVLAVSVGAFAPQAKPFGLRLEVSQCHGPRLSDF
jgi:hypothetical protein